jgi:hypothetical protein
VRLSLEHNQVPIPRRAPRKTSLKQVAVWGLPAALVLGVLARAAEFAWSKVASEYLSAYVAAADKIHHKETKERS